MSQQQKNKPIFLRKDGRPVYFYLLPNANVFQVRQLIQKYGGIVMDKQPFRGQDCIVVSNKDILTRQIKRDFLIVSVDYVVKSLDAAVMVPLNSFLLSKKNELQNIKSAQQTQSSPMKKAKIESPLKKNIQTSPIKQSRPVEQPSSPLIKSTASPFKQTQPISSPPRKPMSSPQKSSYTPIKAALSPRKTSADFSAIDDILLFKMVSAQLPKDDKGHVLTYQYDGYQIFHDLYDSGYFSDQTITSLKQRYSTHILPNINSFIFAQDKAANMHKKRNFETQVDLELEEPPQSMHMDSSFEFSTQAVPLHNTAAFSSNAALDYSVDCQERDVALHLADLYEVSYELAVYVLYATSGVVKDAQLLLSNPSLHAHLAWDPEHDIIILRHRDSPKTPGYGPLVQAKGLDAVIKRCSFLVSFITNS